MNVPDIKLFEGDFLIFRKYKTRLKKGVGGRKMPHFRHRSLDLATTEAARLALAFPDSLFIIMREVGSVKLETPASAMSAGTAETAQQAQGEARQRDGNEDCRDAQPSSPTPSGDPK